MTGFAAHHHPEQKISTSLIFTILLLVFGVVGVIFVSVVINADRKLRDDLLAQGDHFASAIDRDLLAAVLRNPGDEHLPEYQELKHRLEFSIQLNTRIHYVYFIGKRADGSLFFLMDTGQPSNRDVEARPGELYEDAPEELLHLYDRHESTVIGPYTDQWGTFITTLIPFADPNNNGQVAVMALDVDSSERFSNVFAAAVPLALVMIALLLLFVVALILLIRQLKKSLLRQHLATNALQQSEKLLRISEDRYRSVIAVSNTGVWEFNNRSKYFWASPEYFEMLGRNQKDFLMDGTSNLEEAWITLLHPDDQQKTADHFAEYLKNGSAGMYEDFFRMKHTDGSWVWIWSRGKTLRNPDESLSDLTIGTHINITDQKRIEEQLRQSQKMESIGQLAGGVAHDFNNALAAIIGSSELILGEDNLTDKQRKYLNMILTAAGRAGNSTKKLLVFSRRGTKASSPVDCATITEDTVALLRQTADKAITISLDNRALQTTVIGDDSQLQSALMNIGINAAQAMPGGGELSYTLENLDLDEEYCQASPFDLKPGRYLEIAVRDTGCGIPPELAAHIFEPFFTTKEQGKGTGLGLAMVYGAVQEHGGAITVYSEVGSGTVLHLYLPLTGEMVGPKSEAPLIVRGNGTILVVDDEELIRTTAAALLESLGYRVILAANGQEGVDIFREAKDEIDLVILDMIMPVMGGRETFGKLREVDPTIAVLIASGFSKEEDQAELKKQGANGFLNKPFRKVELAERVGVVLGNHNIGADKSHSTPRRLTREDLQAIPLELKEAVAAAVAMGDMKQIKHHIQTIASLNSALAAPLGALAELYAYDQLIELFTKE